MKTQDVIYIGIAGALLYYIFGIKKQKRSGSVEIPPPDAFRLKYTMTAGSVLYSNQQLTSNTGIVFRGGEEVWNLKDLGDVKFVDYRMKSGQVKSGYIKNNDIRK